MKTKKQRYVSPEVEVCKLLLEAAIAVSGGGGPAPAPEKALLENTWTTGSGTGSTTF